MKDLAHKRFAKSNLVFGMSPLGLLTLSACGGGGEVGDQYESRPVSGAVIKGPLSNALVGLDYDGDGRVDSETVRTDASGNFSVSTNEATYTVIAWTDESTIDSSSGAVLSGITLKAPEGATVVTPTTTLMQEGSLTSDQVVRVLGLPNGIDPLTFNPFAVGVSAAEGLAVEKTSQQIMSVVNAFAAAAEGSGATEAAAYTAALNSILEVVKIKASSNGSLDLTDATDLTLIKAQVSIEIASIADANVDAFNALSGDTAMAIKNVNMKIATVSDLFSDASKNIFSTTQVLADQVKTAVTAEISNAGSGSIPFTDINTVNTSANNKAPTDIAISASVISEKAISLVIGELNTTDSDQTPGVEFKYAIAEVEGSDYAAFSIDQAKGELSLLIQPNYETKSSYSVTILSTDAGGKTFSKSFSISVKEAPNFIISDALGDTSVNENGAYTSNVPSIVGDTPVGDLVYSLSGTDAALFGIDISTGVVTMAAKDYENALDSGANNIYNYTITATDQEENAASKDISITMLDINEAPTITSSANTSTTEGEVYNYTFVASDEDINDALTYSTSTLPSWLSFNASSGILSGTPGERDGGFHTVTLTATDAAGLTATQLLKLSTTTGSVTVGGSYSGTLDEIGDKDWVAVELTNGQAVGISLSGDSRSFAENSIGDPEHDPTMLNCGCPSCVGSVKQEFDNTEVEAALIDPYVYVYDQDGNLIKSDDDGGSGRDSYLTFTPSYSGTYYIEARAWRDNYTGDYKINVAEVVPPSPTDALVWGNSVWDTSQTINVFFADNGVTVSDGTTSTGFSDAEETGMMGMLSNVTNFANINFQLTEIQADADIRFAHSDLGGGLLGYMFPQNYSSNEGLGVLTNNPTYWNDASMQVGGFMYGVVVHEIGHGLGLAHPHDTGGGSQVMDGVSYSGDRGDYGQMNQSVYTVMSYNEGLAAHPLGLPSDYGSGYMASFAALDMAVLQNYYGGNNAHNAGSDTYSLGSRDYFETIWDGGGTDEIVVTGSADCLIDLRAATLKYEVGGAGFASYNSNALGGFTIANGVVIENAKGGGGSDVIIGNDSNNIIFGGSDSGIRDTLTGNDGVDTFVCTVSDGSTDANTTDIITDFKDGTDLIGLDNGLSFVDLTFSQNGSITQIIETSSDNLLLLLDDFTYDRLTSDDFVTVDFV